MGRIVDILRGSRSKVLAAYGVADCPTYGVCRTETKLSVTGHVKAMVSSGYLRVEGTEYPTLEVTSTGREVLQGLRTVELEQREDASSRGSVQKPRRLDAVPAGTSVPLLPDRQLVERLRQLRSELAEEEGVAPFLIFHDKTLKAIAGSKPESRAALLEIPGIGEMKAERYGRRVLAVINEAQ